MSDLQDRERAIIPNHVVPIATQTLHTLLRLEELMSSILAGLRHFAKQQDPSFGKPVSTGKDPVDVADLVEKPKAKRK